MEIFKEIPRRQACYHKRSSQGKAFTAVFCTPTGTSHCAPETQLDTHRLFTAASRESNTILYREKLEF